jgi:hypothetical protein
MPICISILRNLLNSLNEKKREREEDRKEHREHLHRRVLSLIRTRGYGFI